MLYNILVLVKKRRRTPLGLSSPSYLFLFTQPLAWKHIVVNRSP